MQNIGTKPGHIFCEAMKILVIEDEPKIADMVRTLMEVEGYTCLTASDGCQGLSSFEFHRPNLVILDWNLPGDINGIDICNQIRRSVVIDPYILMLSSRQSVEDRLDGLSSGADDYLSKPFHPKELTIRVRALLRRQLRQVEEDKSSIIESPRLRINGESLTIYIRSSIQSEFTPLKEKLSARSVKVLMALAENPGRVWTRDDLIAAVWGDDFGGGDRVVDAYIKQLRAKLKILPGARSDQFIKTKIGLGYFFEDIP